MNNEFKDLKAACKKIEEIERELAWYKDRIKYAIESDHNNADFLDRTYEDYGDEDE